MDRAATIGDVVRLRRGTHFRPGRITVLVLTPPDQDGVCLGVEVTRTDGGTPWRLTRRAIWLGVAFPPDAVARVVERKARLEPALQFAASVRVLKFAASRTPAVKAG